jgi:hypothetical protein
MATNDIDLTPFGFTPTETRVYNALLELGPSGGYAVAQYVGVARANTYQAIAALVTKGAVTRISEDPIRVRALRPDSLLALVASRRGDELTALDEQIRRRGRVEATDGLVPISSTRSLNETATRLIVREEGLISAVAPTTFFAATTPAWRKREADGRSSELWRYGPAIDGILGVDVLPEHLNRFFPPSPLLISATAGAIWCVSDDGGTRGWFSQDQLCIGLTRAAIATISRT